MNDNDRIAYNVEAYVNRIDLGTSEIRRGTERIESLKADLKELMHYLRKDEQNRWRLPSLEDVHRYENEGCFTPMFDWKDHLPEVQRYILVLIAASYVSSPKDKDRSCDDPFTTSKENREHLPEFACSLDITAKILDALVTKMHAERNQPVAAAAF